jgi:hypothetical protein
VVEVLFRGGPLLIVGIDARRLGRNVIDDRGDLVNLNIRSLA